MDLHQRETQLCIRAANGALVERRIATTRVRLTGQFGGRPRARILLEASTESEWVAQHLEALGHEVIVADPNFAAMYATRTRRTKTDRRDARALLTALEVGAYRRAYRTSAARRHVRAELAVRDTLVRMRVRCVTLARSLARRDGLRPPTCTPEVALARITALEALTPTVAQELAPLAAVVAPLTAEIRAADARLAAVVAGPRGGAARDDGTDRPRDGHGRGGHPGRQHALPLGASGRSLRGAGPQ